VSGLNIVSSAEENNNNNNNNGPLSEKAPPKKNHIKGKMGGPQHWVRVCQTTRQLGLYLLEKEKKKKLKPKTHE